VFTSRDRGGAHLGRPPADRSEPESTRSKSGALSFPACSARSTTRSTFCLALPAPTLTVGFPELRCFSRTALAFRPPPDYGSGARGRRTRLGGFQSLDARPYRRQVPGFCSAIRWAQRSATSQAHCSCVNSGGRTGSTVATAIPVDRKMSALAAGMLSSPVTRTARGWSLAIARMSSGSFMPL
jgi:hypothetical protein